MVYALEGLVFIRFVGNLNQGVFHSERLMTKLVILVVQIFLIKLASVDKYFMLFYRYSDKECCKKMRWCLLEA